MSGCVEADTVGMLTFVPGGAGIDWLIDNATAYDAVMDAIAAARRSVWLTQLAFDADCRAYGPSGRESIVADALLAAAARGPVDVRIILNETFLLDTARALRRFFADRRPFYAAGDDRGSRRQLVSLPAARKNPHR